jgi:hypothetical protein
MFPPSTGYIVIAGATPIGRATAGPDGLDFNAGGLEGPMVTRHIAIQNDSYPLAWAHAADLLLKSYRVKISSAQPCGDAL